MRILYSVVLIVIANSVNSFAAPTDPNEPKANVATILDIKNAGESQEATIKSPLTELFQDVAGGIDGGETKRIKKSPQHDLVN